MPLFAILVWFYHTATDALFATIGRIGVGMMAGGHDVETLAELGF